MHRTSPDLNTSSCECGRVLFGRVVQGWFVPEPCTSFVLSGMCLFSLVSGPSTDSTADDIFVDGLVRVFVKLFLPGPHALAGNLGSICVRHV